MNIKTKVDIQSRNDTLSNPYYLYLVSVIGPRLTLFQIIRES